MQALTKGKIPYIIMASALVATGLLFGGYALLKGKSDDATVSPPAYESDSVSVVSFESMGGTFIEAQLVRAGEKVIKPTDPEKEGFIFEGWEKDGKIYDFNSPVTGDIVLISRWRDDGISAKVIIVFNSAGGSLIQDIKVAKNTSINKPLDPTKQGYVFAGWYNGNTKFDFTIPITDNVILTAKWEIASEESINNNTPNINTNPTPSGPNENTNPPDSITVALAGQPAIEYTSAGEIIVKGYAAKVWNSATSSWTNADVDGYEIARSVSANGTYSTIKTTSDLSTTIAGLDISTRYFYQVRAYKNTNSTRVYGSYSREQEVPAMNMTKPSNLFFTGNTSDYYRLTFNTVPNAPKYLLYRADTKNGPYHLARSSDTNLIYLSSSLTGTKDSYWKLVPANISGNEQSKVYGPESDIIFVPFWFGGWPSVTRGSGSTQLSLTITGVTGADGYQVYVSYNGDTDLSYDPVSHNKLLGEWQTNSFTHQPYPLQTYAKIRGYRRGPNYEIYSPTRVIQIN